MGHQGVGWTDDPRSNPLELPTPQDNGDIVYYKSKVGEPAKALIWHADTCAECDGRKKRFTAKAHCYSFSLRQGEVIESPLKNYRYHARQRNEACLFSSAPKPCS